MTIESITPIAVALPLAAPMKLADAEIATADNVVVRVQTRDGLVGWGEAPAAPAMTGETVESMVAAVKYLTPFLVGRDAGDLAGNLAEMDARIYGNDSAKSALDLAFHDLVGKRANKPVHALLGTCRRARTPVLWILAGGTRDADADEARRKIEDGFAVFKLKVGVNSVGVDVERAAAARDAVGDGAVLSADANQAWTPDDAIRFVMGAAPARLDFVEQPIPGEDLEGMARVAAATDTPIGADEGIHRIADIRRHHERGAARGGSLKLIKLGGLIRAREAAELCDKLGMKVNLAGKIAESSIATAALLHLAAVVPALDWGLSPSNQYLAADLVRDPIRIADGHAAVPDGPGLGIDVDEDALARYRRPM